MSKGKIYIIGAGSGGIDYLTLKAHKVITEIAEVLIYDRLISKDIIEHIPDNVEKIFAGKEPNLHHMTQEQINDKIIEYAKDGKMVARLKGGDPMIFGRGGEEVDKAKENGIDYEIIPGITAASAFSAEMEIPLTYRNISEGVIFISGHSYKNEEPQLDWTQLAKTNSTIIIYMGVSNIKVISDRLIENGMSKEKPVCVMQNIGMENSKYLFSSISKIADDIKESSIENPAIIAIGEVVKKSRKYSATK